MPLSEWTEALHKFGVPTHLVQHLAVMAELRAQEGYDRMMDDLFKLTATTPTSLYDFLELHNEDEF